MLGWELPPHNSGGLGVACYQLCKALAKKGADIDFVLPYRADHGISFMRITAAHPQSVADVQRAGIAYDSARYTFTDGSAKNLDIFDQQALYEQGVADIARTRPQAYDVVHAHDWLTFRAGLRAREVLGCPLVVHVHSIERDRAGGNSGNPMVREIEGLTFLLADRIVAVSEHTKQLIAQDYDIPLNKISVVHNSIEPNGLDPLDPDNAYRYLAALKAQGYRVVVNVGRLTIQKGLPNLLHAARDVVARAPKTMFLLVGSGEQYFELIQLAADLGLSRNVIFTSFQRGKRWRDAYAIGDLFVMPSISEPFGLTALEAVGYGTPVLVSKQSGVAEVLRNALTVNFWDTRELANKITAVMQNDALRNELHAGVYQEFQKLTWDDSADKLMATFRRHACAASGAAV